jgi:quercetin dioxygenase-like cupin family protein
MFIRSYTGTDGQLHPQEYDDIPNGRINVDLSEGQPQGLSIRAIPPGHFRDFHNPPRKVMMVTLSGEGEIGYGDGTKRRVKAGDIHFEDDVTGQGHTFGVVGDKPRVTLVIPVK